MIAPARVAAYDALLAVSSARADLPHALSRSREALRDERDRALAAEITTGTLRWQGTFDHVAGVFARRAPSRLDPEILVILRMTMFQLLHLDRVPASAAVNDAVSLARRAGKTSAAPLVNAILRRVSRERSKLPLPSPPASGAPVDDVVDYLAVTQSHPSWLVARWARRFGVRAAEEWTRFNNTPAPLCLRANRLKNTRDELALTLRGHGVASVPGRFAPDALVITDGNPLFTPLARTGAFVVQDEASQLVAVVANATAGERVLDACASPGGKTTAMAAGMAGTGIVVASDVRAGRVDLLARTVRASGATNIRIVQADVARPLPFAAVFDCVLLDAPCSGLGTLRRDPDIKWRRSAGDLIPLAAAQLRMLHETARVVRPGGRLIYATCSSEPDENDEVVEAFLAESRFELGSLSSQAGLAPLVDRSGYFRTLPFRHGLEAFFAAVLVNRA